MAWSGGRAAIAAVVLGLCLGLGVAPRAARAEDPNFIAVGAFYKGSGKDLGSVVEFKTGGEFAYRFDDHSRLGLQFDHISNAGIGKHNPGTESLVLFWSFPFGAVQR